MLSQRRSFSSLCVVPFIFAGMLVTSASYSEARSDNAVEIERSDSFSENLVVAEVGDRKVTFEELVFRYANLPAGMRSRYETQKGMASFLEDLVAGLALASHGETTHLEDHPLFDRLMEIRREEILGEMVVREIVKETLGANVVEERYEAQRESRFRRKPALHVRQILITSPRVEGKQDLVVEGSSGDDSPRARIEAIRDRIEKGELAFDEAARRYSEDGSARDGGDLGWVGPGELVEALDRVLFGKRTESLDGVITSELGYHLLDIVDSRPGGVIPFSAVQELLLQEIVGEHRDRLGALMERTRAEARKDLAIRTYPERLPW